MRRDLSVSDVAGGAARGVEPRPGCTPDAAARSASAAWRSPWGSGGPPQGPGAVAHARCEPVGARRPEPEAAVRPAGSAEGSARPREPEASGSGRRAWDEAARS